MLLAKDGIFPIVRDQEGHLLSNLPASGFPFPGTIQGEGKLCGVPSLFIRLAGCNLHCCWKSPDGQISPCDTTYAAYEINGAQQYSVEDIYHTLLQNTDHIRHIVITGGEPLLQWKELTELCIRLKENNRYHITLETNATLFQEELTGRIDFFSLSPKLNSSHQPEEASRPLRLNPECIQAYIDHACQHHKDFQLKFVYACENDIPEIQSLLAQLHHWKNEDILLMPLGGTQKILRTNTIKTLEYCIRKGWRYCDRLHISLFGDKAGV